ncbi:YggT family protein [Microbacterium protaetiae]|uniref:YggT family protein n=1 Tax=Microbacterium protaetiae TaxID=2509458 RepID=A0A4P6EGM1_9MICO|nr:YggT family protein [Microbacterium protaetiae]QAY61582.1 YggT family protein [Microbacterium protaetiae]
MGIVGLIAAIVNTLLLLYVLVLFARMILDIIPIVNRGWRPKGAGLVFAEIVYTLTDPPLRLLRRFVRPVRIGAVSIDLSFTIVILVCFVLMSITGALSVL